MKSILYKLVLFLLFTCSSHAYYQAEQGRWISRDPIGERGGINLFSFVVNNPVVYVDILGLDGNDPPSSVLCSLCGDQVYDPGSQGCCNDTTPYSLSSQCCEQNSVVDKVTIYIFEGKLGGDGASACDVGKYPLSHSYYSGNESGVPSYGKHPRSFTDSGNPLKGPGYVNREDQRSDGKPGRDPSKARKSQRQVCPAEAARMQKEGPTKDPYWVGGKNCHSYAQGRSD